ncbi:unnamed protein product (mitochondrion) [Plasmodiophora brassicae]|uniref:Uncharacterized protein n=1 Tax=Plasmodiophora brassicae TaxID=37360 RepID=A0A3P3YFR7_PLABS|nr:unnamed protein product [Plasmodiophora brassicae]
MASSSPRTRSQSSSQRVWRLCYHHDCWPLVGAVVLCAVIVIALQAADLLDEKTRVLAPRVVIVMSVVLVVYKAVVILHRVCSRAPTNNSASTGSQAGDHGDPVLNFSVANLARATALTCQRRCSGQVRNTKV